MVTMPVPGSFGWGRSPGAVFGVLELPICGVPDVGARHLPWSNSHRSRTSLVIVRLVEADCSVAQRASNAV